MCITVPDDYNARSAKVLAVLATGGDSGACRFGLDLNGSRAYYPRHGN